MPVAHDPSRVLTTLVLLLLTCAASQAGATDGDVFAGDVRLALPRVIYAVEGVEANVYFDNAVLVINPSNYVFDVTCNVGYQYDDRWTLTAKTEEVGDHPITLEVRDQSNAVIARARSTVRIAPASTGRDQRATLLIAGDSHVQRDFYPQHLLDLGKADAHLELTLVGSRGRGNQPPTDDLRHEGYNGWTAAAFATMAGTASRTGIFKRPDTGSPFIYTDNAGAARLDFARYANEFNAGRPIDFIVLQVGGNDIWRATDDDIDTYVDAIFGHFETLIRAIHDASPTTHIGVAMVDPLTRSQHGYRNYRGERKQTRWQYRRNQHRMMERQIETYGDRESDNVFLLPVALNIDCVRGFPMRTYPVHARTTEKEQRVNDGAHLSPEGYAQFADPIYAWIKVCLSR